MSRDYLDHEKEVIDLWRGGMSMTDIAGYLEISTARVSMRVRRNFKREKMLSSDGRSWFWSLTRMIDESAPLSPHDQFQKYSSPDQSRWHFSPDEERCYVDWAFRLMEIMDDLNGLIEQVSEQLGYRVVIVERDDGYLFGTLLPASQNNSDVQEGLDGDD